MPTRPVLLWPDGAPGALGAGDEDRLRITPFPVKSDKPAGAVVVLPGGGYCMRAAHEGEPVARWLNTLGIASFVVDYRVSPYRHPVPLGDAQRALRWVRANARQYNVDPQRIGILGFSAGGHLAGSAGTIFDDGKSDAADPVERESCRPDCLILCYAVLTFGEHRHHGSMTNLLGGEWNEDLRQYLSLENRVTARTPPTFLWHTADDNAVPMMNSLLFAEALDRCKVPFALHVFPHGTHGVGLAQDNPTLAAWTGLCARWLVDLGFANPGRRT